MVYLGYHMISDPPTGTRQSSQPLTTTTSTSTTTLLPQKLIVTTSTVKPGPLDVLISKECGMW